MRRSNTEKESAMKEEAIRISLQRQKGDARTHLKTAESSTAESTDDGLRRQRRSTRKKG